MHNWKQLFFYANIHMIWKYNQVKNRFTKKKIRHRNKIIYNIYSAIRWSIFANKDPHQIQLQIQTTEKIVRVHANISFRTISKRNLFIFWRWTWKMYFRFLSRIHSWWNSVSNKCPPKFFNLELKFSYLFLFTNLPDTNVVWILTKLYLEIGKIWDKSTKTNRT